MKSSNKIDFKRLSELVSESFLHKIQTLKRVGQRADPHIGVIQRDVYAPSLHILIRIFN